MGTVAARHPAAIDAAQPDGITTPAGPLYRLERFEPDGTSKIRPGRDPLAAQAAQTAVTVSRSLGPREVGKGGLLQTTYVPVSRYGHVEAVMKVASDVGPARALMLREFLVTSLELSLLIACSCGVPYYWRTRQKQHGEKRIAFLAHHDMATGLLNRISLTSSLDRQLRDTQRRRKLTAVHFIDLDRFKTVNDTLGHNIGDELIRAVAERLKSLAGEHDAVGRFGGDEFVLAQFALSEIGAAEALALTIAEKLSEPFNLGHHEVSVSASIGVSVAPIHGINAEALLNAADVAMYRAKFDGRNTVRIYTPDMDAELQQRRHVEAALRTAVETDGGFVLNYQPIVDAQSDKLLGFEALLRLPVAGREPIPPAIFIPIAEEMGMITRVGEWVLRRACKVAAEWPPHLMIAVNLSPKQFEDGGLAEVVAAALKDAGLAPERLELEITEGLLLHETEKVLSQLHNLKALGVSIAMDDFGTGYSSLSYLWRFPFDKLKIDRSFMSVLAQKDENVVNILKTIVSLGRTMNLQVTAEGVETHEQAKILQSLDCDQLQGYHFGRPISEIDTAARILKSIAGSVEAARPPDLIENSAA